MVQHAYLSISGIVHIYMETIICYTAGESKGNPGQSAIAVYITNDGGEVIQEINHLIGNATAAFASYNAVMVCLQNLQNLYEDKTKTMSFDIRLDSELVAQHLNAKTPINDPGLVPMFIEIHNMRITSFPNLTLTLISNEESMEANRLLKEALDGK